MEDKDDQASIAGSVDGSIAGSDLSELDALAGTAEEGNAATAIQARIRGRKQREARKKQAQEKKRKERGRLALLHAHLGVPRITERRAITAAPGFGPRPRERASDPPWCVRGFSLSTAKVCRGKRAAENPPLFWSVR